MSIKKLSFIVLLLALLCAGLLSLFASQSPDGLEHVADKQHFATAQRDPPIKLQLLNEYELSLLPNKTLGRSAAGIIGVLVVLAVTLSWGKVLTRKKEKSNKDNMLT